MAQHFGLGFLGGGWGFKKQGSRGEFLGSWVKMGGRNMAHRPYVACRLLAVLAAVSCYGEGRFQSHPQLTPTPAPCARSSAECMPRSASFRGLGQLPGTAAGVVLQQHHLRTQEGAPISRGSCCLCLHLMPAPAQCCFRYTDQELV